MVCLRAPSHFLNKGKVLEMAQTQSLVNQKAKHGFMYNMRKYWMLYIMVIPTVVGLFIFNYLPLYGLRMAFYDFRVTTGWAGAKYVGWANFKMLFNMPDFSQVLWNTIIINIYKLLFSFPMPILFAILLNELRGKRVKRVVQTISYLPHFVSWMIISGILYALINSSYGLINNVIKSLGFIPPKWYVRPDLWRGLLVFSEIWKGVGFGSILYLAAISNINAEMYEAAVIDGASRFKQIIYITLPCLLPTIMVMFILNMGSMMSGNFQQIFALVGSNMPLYKTVNVLDYKVYQLGMQNSNYSVATAMGIFQSSISFMLVVLTNWISNKVGDYGVW